MGDTGNLSGKPLISVVIGKITLHIDFNKIHPLTGQIVVPARPETEGCTRLSGRQLSQMIKSIQCHWEVSMRINTLPLPGKSMPDTKPFNLILLQLTLESFEA